MAISRTFLSLVNGVTIRHPLIHAEDGDEGIGREALVYEGLGRPLTLASTVDSEGVEHDGHQVDPAGGVGLGRGGALLLAALGPGALHELEGLDGLEDALLVDLQLLRANVENRAAPLVSHHDVENDPGGAGSERGGFAGRGGLGGVPLGRGLGRRREGHRGRQENDQEPGTEGAERTTEWGMRAHRNLRISWSLRSMKGLVNGLYNPYKVTFRIVAPRVFSEPRRCPEGPGRRGP